MNEYFNSIKVRLKLGFQGDLIGTVNGFQFHKGTIKTSRSGRQRR